MDLSILFGTYNRLNYLQRCVQSIRGAAKNISHEIIICDGGSTDGTRQWLSEQPDIVFLGDKQLDGATVAFNRVFALARGKHICTLNDDAVLLNDAVLEDGLDVLDKMPWVGQVAFEYWDGQKWLLQHTHPGYLYANFGITRGTVARTIAKLVGGLWTPCYWTYGADCELACWVHKLGWQVAGLLGTGLCNTPAPDTLRKNNHTESRAKNDGQTFWSRWPKGTAILPDGQSTLVNHEALKEASTTQFNIPEDFVRPAQGSLLRRLKQVDPEPGKPPPQAAPRLERIVHGYLQAGDEHQTSQVAALQALGGVAYQQLDWRNLGKRFPEMLVQACKANQPTLVFLQLQTEGVLQPKHIAEIRRHVRDPRLVIATWSGDVAKANAPNPQALQWAATLGRACDLTLWTTQTHVEVLRAMGVTAAYLQIGYDEDRYYPNPRPRSYQWDVTFLYRAYSSELSQSLGNQNEASLRDELAAGLRLAFPKDRLRVGACVLPPVSGDVYRASRLAVSASITSKFTRYSSDRLLRALACGTTTLVKRFDGHESWGLVHGENCLLFETAEECVQLAKEFVHRDADLTRIGNAGAKLAKEHHTWSVRMKELAVLLGAVRSNIRPFNQAPIIEPLPT